jgi:hypothetical protein
MRECGALRSEPAVKDLLNEEIARLLMRADHVERHQVEALVTRVGAERALPANRPKGKTP